jgi:cell division protein FtsQ
MKKKKAARARAKAPARRQTNLKSSRKIAFKPFLVRFWWVLRGALVGVACVGIVYAGYLGFEELVKTPALSVRSIQVKGCESVSTSKVLRMSGVRIGDPLLKVDLEDVRHSIVRHPRIKDALVARHLPDTLVIQVMERQPIAVIYGDDGFMMTDGEGFVLARTDSYTVGYPLISGTEDDPLPGQMAEGSLPAIKALTRLSSSGLIGADRISEISSVDGKLLVSLVETGTVLVMSTDNVASDISRLGRLMEKGLFDTQSAGYDLRFDGRVVKLPERRDGGGA